MRTMSAEDWPYNAGLWFATMLGIGFISTCVQRYFGWVIWWALIAAVMSVWLLWKVAPI